MSRPLRAIVASRNPVKMRAVAIGLARALDGREVDVEGIAVPSGVDDQPMSDAETLRGAENRALEASRLRPEADVWVGLEGGLETVGEELHAFGWIVVRSADGDGHRVGRSRTATFALPERVAELIAQGVELGDACDRIFARHNVKQSEGAVGILTRGVIDRAGLYEPAVVLAMAPLLDPSDAP